MSASSPTGVSGYLAVFAVLLVLTVVTVTSSTLPVAMSTAIALGLAIAAIKAALVALYFMHLRHERQAIYVTLAFTAIFAAGLFALTLWTEADHVPGTRFAPAFDSVEVPR
jgi:cytochrome c oxidase subunit 4